MKNYLLLVPFSIAGLISLFFIAKTSIPQRGSLSEIDSSSVGKTVSVTGKIISKKVHSAGHVFLTISDGDSRVTVPLFSGYLKNLEKEGITQYNLRIGTEISVIGTVQEYQGTIEIIPKKTSDIKILS